MSKLDGKGPEGQGSRTGRKMGKCTNFGASKKSITDDSTKENSNTNGQGIGKGRGQGGSGFGLGLGRKNHNRIGE